MTVNTKLNLALSQAKTLQRLKKLQGLTLHLSAATDRSRINNQKDYLQGLFTSINQKRMSILFQ